MKCHNCNRNALYRVEIDNSWIPLCLDCYIKYQNITLRTIDMLERRINFIHDDMESFVGLPGILPRYQTQRSVIHTEKLNLNNIRVSNSEIGVLNTGTIGNVDATVTVLKNEKYADLAAAITALTEAVIRSIEIRNEEKDQILELLNALSEEAVSPKEKQKKTVVKTLLTKLSELLSVIGSLKDLWEIAAPLYRQVFGL